MDFKKLLFELCESYGVSGLSDTLNIVRETLSSYISVEESSFGSVVGRIKGESDYTIMLDAHIDEIGMIVTFVNEDGFVKVSAMGGIDTRILPSMPVIIHSNEKIRGVFCSIPPHLKKDDSKKTTLNDVWIDTGNPNASNVIKKGDRVTFVQSPCELSNGIISGKALDNRTGVVALLLVASKLCLQKKLPCNIVFLFSDQEELGLRGAKTQTFNICPNEAIVLDVSFGKSPQSSDENTGTLGLGGMIGVSPCLSKKITDNLIKTARDYKIPFQYEVMGEKTSTNADIISLTKDGVACGLVSIPLRNMHTPVETVMLSDIENVAILIEKYILSKGDLPI